MRSVIASLLSLAALGMPPLVLGLAMLAIFYSVSCLSLKNFSILSFSKFTRSVVYCFLRSKLSPRFSVIADDAESYL